MQIDAKTEMSDFEVIFLKACIIAMLIQMSDTLLSIILNRVKKSKLAGVLWLFVEKETSCTSLNSGLRVFFFTEVLYLDFFPISGCKMLREREKQKSKKLKRA